MQITIIAAIAATLATLSLLAWSQAAPAPQRVEGTDDVYIFRSGNAQSNPQWGKWPGYAVALPMVARRYCRLWGRGT